MHYNFARVESANHVGNGGWACWSRAVEARTVQEKSGSMISTAIDKLLDKLPPWGKLIFWTIAILVTVYGIARYGLGRILLRAIFSP